MKTITFRFDIDTHKCIRDGVPNLLDLTKEYGIKFTFFINLGQAVAFWESVQKLVYGLWKKDNACDNIKMMSALQKLGLRDYLFAAFINPPIYMYKKQIKLLINSTSEVGIHGGKNHAVWHGNAMGWDDKVIWREIDWAKKKLLKFSENYRPSGFASPGWESPQDLANVLIAHGFQYCADRRCINRDEIVKKDGKIAYIGVNLLGEPGGVAFFEYCRVMGLSDDEIVRKVVEAVERNEHTVIYDHPYYAGTRELACIRKILRAIQELGNVRIVTLEELL